MLTPEVLRGSGGGFVAEAGEVDGAGPTAVTYRTYDDVPEAIASAASEAHQALGAKAPRASVAMARAVVEAS